jgi:hypothetical protein
MKIYNLLNMGKLRTLLATAAGGLALAGCEASADNSKDTTNEAVRVASMNVIEQAKTQADCLKLGLETNEKIMVCMRDVTARESAARQAEIAAKTEVLETEKEANDQRRTTNVVLSEENQRLEKEVEVLEKVVAMQEEPTR